MYPLGYSPGVPTVHESRSFQSWMSGLRDREAQARVNARVFRLQLGNPGDAKPVGDGIIEMRIPYGPGYRVYYMERGKQIVVLLCGGDKATQSRDIARAKEIASAWKE
jgi:putative addiction module killer protein